MQVQIFTKVDASFECVALDGNTISQSGIITMPNSWHKCYINIHRRDITDIKIGDESIRHCINSGINTPDGYEIWLHGDPAQYFSRIAKCIAQDDLLRFENLEDKYLITESWNVELEQDFLPASVKQFFATGEGPSRTYYAVNMQSGAKVPSRAAGGARTAGGARGCLKPILYTR